MITSSMPSGMVVRARRRRCSRSVIEASSTSAPARSIDAGTRRIPRTPVGCSASASVASPISTWYVVRRARAGFSPRPEVVLDCGSRSISRTGCPISPSAAPRLMAVVVLPTPPFWLTMARTGTLDGPNIWGSGWTAGAVSRVISGTSGERLGESLAYGGLLGDLDGLRRPAPAPQGVGHGGDQDHLDPDRDLLVNTAQTEAGQQVIRDVTGAARRRVRVLADHPQPQSDDQDRGSVERHAVLGVDGGEQDGRDQEAEAWPGAAPETRAP